MSEPRNMAEFLKLKRSESQGLGSNARYLSRKDVGYGGRLGRHKPKPPDNPAMASIAMSFSKLKHGKFEGMEYARKAIARYADLEPVVKLWDDLTLREKKQSSINDLCERAGVDAADFLGNVVAEMTRHNLYTAEIISSQAMPDIVQAGVRAAKTIRGTKDRELFYQHTGFTPVPKGNSIQILNNVRTNNLPSADDDIPELPPFERSTIESSQVIRKELPAAVEAELCTADE